MYGIGLILLGLLLAVPAQQASALALKADATLIPDPTGGQISGEVTFDLPQRVRIGDTTFKICQTDKTPCGVVRAAQFVNGDDVCLCPAQ